ncbi:MAG TPA: hypothetical protein DCQ53_04965, partial [Alphaproteobacteria bacterium]|nr:hypothetical protein [Alphaproteobacteria bacterium]
AAFQSRIRQNYELLSDFMLNMGTVAGGRRSLDLPSNEVPDPLSRRAKPRSEVKTEDAGEAPAPDAPLDNEAAQRRDHVGFPERGRASDPGWRWKDLLATMAPEEGEAEMPARKRRSRDEDES